MLVLVEPLGMIIPVIPQHVLSLRLCLYDGPGPALSYSLRSGEEETRLKEDWHPLQPLQVPVGCTWLRPWVS